MASRSVELAVRMSVDAADVATEFGTVGDSARRMADDVDAAASKADGATSRMDSVAESADGMASSSAQAAGGMGDLGGALALMPGPLGAVGAGMEAAAPAIMGVTGASDLANLALRGQRIQTIRATVATKVHTAVTKAQTVAQRALNIAMRANPLGLIITALVVVGGLFVLAYKRSETFRRIVDAVVSRVKALLGGLIDKLGDLVGWVRDKVPAAWEALRSKVSAVVERVKALVGGIRDKVVDAGTAVRDKLGGAFDWVMDKVQPIIDAVNRIIELLGNIDFPDLPFGLGRTTAGRAALPGSTGGGVTYVDNRVFNVELILQALTSLDPAVLRQLIKAIEDQLRRSGATPPSWVAAP